MPHNRFNPRTMGDVVGRGNQKSIRPEVTWKKSAVDLQDIRGVFYMHAGEGDNSGSL